ncbi:BQ2448_933 [Microbotryum intermedium]|uniref:BQ2448_933 protein n=1 Tax=Microbotryum intermedium TaxID=269621 RepID=A0A238F481_9BASI|nr:BQ2448_933 [Microbotryum intermedium]
MFSDASDSDADAHCWSSPQRILTNCPDIIAPTPTLPPRNGASTLAQQAEVEQNDISVLQEQIRQLVKVNEELRMGLQHQRSASQHYEDTVSSLYASLALPDRINYLTRRLRTEPLHHSLRLSVALDREQALTSLAQEREAVFGAEIGMVLSMIEHTQNLKVSQRSVDE